MRHTKHEYAELYGETERDYAPSVFRCISCGEKYPSDYYQEYTYGDDSLCEYCVQEYFKQCQECGEIYDDAEEMCPGCRAELKKLETAAGERYELAEETCRGKGVIADE